MPVDPRSLALLDSLFPHASRASIRRRLLAWFVQHARTLPWRANRDPYRIWISEVMLQQTQVATVVPYFERFLRRFPTLTSLAGAAELHVLRLWAGLGYYRRASNLLQSARILHEKQYSTIPNDPALLHTLPGFGRYTVNAVLSQAYDRRLPVLEANSRRVLCRLFAIENDPRQPAVQDMLWQLAAMLLPRKTPGNFNQAVMELGALVCVPTRPHCPECPLAQFCQAHLLQRQEHIPPPIERSKPIAVEEVAIVVRRKNLILLVQRPAVGRWANMWECPHLSLDGHKSPITAAKHLLALLGLSGAIIGEITTIRHTVTGHHITMTCLEVDYRGGPFRTEAYPGHAWVTLGKWNKYPISAPQRQLLQRLLKR